MCFVFILLAAVGLVCDAHGESVDPVSISDSDSVTETKEAPWPYCGDDGCFNGGRCDAYKDGLVVAGTNHTGVCKCMPGWTGSDCSTCNGRVELIADYAPTNGGQVPVIHDGHRNYSSNAASKCSWLIKASPDLPDGPLPLIKVKILNFETECGWDHLYIFDGTSAINSTTKAAYCGIVNVEHTVYAENGAAFLHFYSDMAYNMSGFEISYELVDKKDELEVGVNQGQLEPEPDQDGNKWGKWGSPENIGRGKAVLHTIQG